MPIKLIVNGFFRSGTTIFWEIINRSNFGVQNFYEPFHPNLKSLISKSDDINLLHGLSLWGAYQKLDPTVLRALLSLNPNQGKHMLPDEDMKILRYLDFYHSFDSDVILQPNRLHFKLDLVARDYEAKIIHIIREPMSVWNSICRISVEFARFSKVRSCLGSLNSLRAFDQRNIYLYLLGQLRISRGMEYYLYSFKPFYVFVFNWVTTNYYAIKSTEAANGLVINFDLLLKDESLDRSIYEYSGFNFDRSVVTLGRNISSDSKFSDDLHLALKKLHLVDKYKYIYSFLQS